jgi:DNA-binding LytR/AlgR family response regulator
MSYLHQTVFGGAAFGPIFTGPLWVFSEWMTQGQTAMAMSPLLMLLLTTWIGLCMAVLRFVLESKPAVEETVEAPRLINRIEGYQGEGVMRLTVNDHFVEIVTLTGEIHRLRLRFSDAVREMAPVEGFCVHRSHWVSRAAISRVERESGRETVRMVDGSHVPIGRKYRSNLVDAGLV